MYIYSPEGRGDILSWRCSVKSAKNRVQYKGFCCVLCWGLSLLGASCHSCPFTRPDPKTSDKARLGSFSRATYFVHVSCLLCAQQRILKKTNFWCSCTLWPWPLTQWHLQGAILQSAPLLLFTSTIIIYCCSISVLYFCPLYDSTARIQWNTEYETLLISFKS